MKYKKSELFVIVDDSYSTNPFKDDVYTDFNEAEKDAIEIRKYSSNPTLVTVINVDELGEYNYSNGADAARYS